MAAFLPGEPRRRPAQNPDRDPREGMTGMGFQTQRHFIDVKQKMNDYIGEQQGFFDRSPAPSGRVPVDGSPVVDKSSSKSLSSHSTSSSSSSKHEAHGGSSSARKHESHGGSSPAGKHESHSKLSPAGKHVELAKSPNLGRGRHGGKH